VDANAMSEHTGIEWCDSTANYWNGCTRVSEEEHGGGGCDNCYAESMNKWLHGGENWGPGAPRRKIATTSRIVRSWQLNAAKFHAQHGRRRRVFVNSISDTFDNEVEQAWREEIWADARACPDLLFMIVTKRIGNARAMLPADWADGYPNVMLLVTAVNQKEVDRDVPKLLALPARWRGLSVEPMLGPINLTDISEGHADASIPKSFWVPGFDNSASPPAVGHNALTGERWQRFGDWRAHGPRLDLVINGGESGRRARPMHPDWPRSLRDQCASAGVQFLFKQHGEWITSEAEDQPVYRGKHRHLGGHVHAYRVGKRAAGRLLDGVEHNEFPEVK
jgi:protein gp37